MNLVPHPKEVAASAETYIYLCSSGYSDYTKVWMGGQVIIVTVTLIVP